MVPPTTAPELFAFLAKQIETFLKEHHNDHWEEHSEKRKEAEKAGEVLDGEHFFRLGFTFSFPVNQVGINKGYLIRWTKGFDLSDAIGQDVCGLLQKEIDKLHLPVKVAALVNDTVGTLMARSYTSPGKSGTFLGGIFGTGTNGAYVEKLSRMGKMSLLKGEEAEYDTSTGDMVVNMEWGSFDNALRVLPQTPYDAALDKLSVNPGIQMFEKMVSGMFLGEILRQAMLHLIKTGKLFHHDRSRDSDVGTTTNIGRDSGLYKTWGLDTALLSVIEADSSEGLRATRQTLEKELDISGASAEDAQAIKVIAHAIGVRSARLGAVAIGAAIVSCGKLKTGEPSTAEQVSATAGAMKEKVLNAAAPLVDAPPAAASADADDVVDIGLDGSVVEYYPGFDKYMREALREIPDNRRLSARRTTRMALSSDGAV